MEIELVRGDITLVKADIIVNDANSALLGGCGTNRAIHWAGGPEILKACLEIRARQGRCPTGEAVITTAGLLPAKYVIHTVGPAWNGGSKRETELLENCYKNSLRLADEYSAKSVAFPNISTGGDRFPKDLAAQIAIRTVRKFGDQAVNIEQVLFVCFKMENYSIYKVRLQTEA